MKKTILILNIILSSLIMIGDIFYTGFGGLWLKGLTSFGFVLMGAVNLIYAIKTKSPLKFYIIMTIGLVFSMLGDIVLNIFFIGGAILFAIGHVFYFIAYCILERFNIKNLIPAALIFVPCALLITLSPIFDFGGILMELVCVFYALVISCMVGKSISNYINIKSLSNLIIMIGSILFCFSDLMLLFDVFAAVPSIFGILCLASYYPAQILLAFSLFKKIEEK